MSLQSEFLELAQAGARGALVTDIATTQKMLVRADGATTGTLGDPALDAAAIAHAEELMWAERSELRDDRLFIDVVHPAPRIICFGAVDFAAALCKVCRAVNWRPFVVDPRKRFATESRFPHAERVVAMWPEEAFAQLGGIDKSTAIAVITHDPKLDDAALMIALRSEAFYIGAMGSRRANQDRRERLTELGASEEDLARIAAPIGLDLGALTAEETALSIVSEIVAIKHHRSGARLKDVQGRIHEVHSSP